MTFGKPDTYLDSRRIFWCSISSFILIQIIILQTTVISKLTDTRLPYTANMLLFFEILTVIMILLGIIMSLPYLESKFTKNPGVIV